MKPGALSQICELLLTIGVDAYEKEGARYLQRVLSSQKKLETSRVRKNSAAMRRSLVNKLSYCSKNAWSFEIEEPYQPSRGRTVVEEGLIPIAFDNLRPQFLCFCSRTTLDEPGR